MRFLLAASLALLAVDARALSMSGGGGCSTDCTFTSVTTNGTAPSLTATGAKFTNNVEVASAALILNGTGANLGFGGASNSTPDFPIDFGVNAATRKSIALYSNGSGGAFYGFGFHENGYLETWRNDALVMSVGASLVGIGTDAGVAPTAALQVNRTGGDILTASNAGATILAVHAGSSATITGNAAITGNLTVGVGSAVARILKTNTASTDLGGAITATCTAETSFSITGVAVGDSCTVTTPAALAASDWVVCRTLLDNVALKYCTQGAAVDPAAMVYHITTIEY